MSSLCGKKKRLKVYFPSQTKPNFICSYGVGTIAKESLLTTSGSFYRINRRIILDNKIDSIEHINRIISEMTVANNYI